MCHKCNCCCTPLSLKPNKNKYILWNSVKIISPLLYIFIFHLENMVNYMLDINLCSADSVWLITVTTNTYDPRSSLSSTPASYIVQWSAPFLYTSFHVTFVDYGSQCFITIIIHSLRSAIQLPHTRSSNSFLRVYANRYILVTIQIYVRKIKGNWAAHFSAAMNYYIAAKCFTCT